MRFSSDRQRRAVFARLNKFAMKPIWGYSGIAHDALLEDKEDRTVLGSTGAKIVAVEDSPYIITTEGVGNFPRGETIILAGEGYKSGLIPGGELKKLVDIEAEKAGLPKEEVEQQIVRLEPEVVSSLERHFLGRPVYSRRKKKKIERVNPVERQERMMEDPSRGRDPYYDYSEEDMAYIAEKDSGRE